jgi:hypothetical protein
MGRLPRQIRDALLHRHALEKIWPGKFDCRLKSTYVFQWRFAEHICRHVWHPTINSSPAVWFHRSPTITLNDEHFVPA